MVVFVCWAGGKRTVAPRILQRLPLEAATSYHEPFVGGGSVLIALLESGRFKGSVHASDINSNLINLYIKIRDDVETFISDFEALYRDTTREAYYQARKEFNLRPTPALFLYLNQLCFRGVYRVNSKGAFNSPYGSQASKFHPLHIRHLSKLFQNVIFTCCDWEAAVGEALADPRACVYLDPPYVKLNKQTFTRYDKGGFHEGDTTHLLSAITHPRVQARIVCSNHSTPAVMGALADWRTEVYNARRAVHSTDPQARASELMAWNTPSLD